MPTRTRNYTPHTRAYDTPIYDPEPPRSSASYSTSSYNWHDYRETTLTWMAPPTNPFEGFTYDEGTFGTGFWAFHNDEDFFEYPRPMADSPPNP